MALRSALVRIAARASSRALSRPGTAAASALVCAARPLAALAAAPRRLFAAAAAPAGAQAVKVPGMGDSITNGTIVSWQKSASSATRTRGRRLPLARRSPPRCTRRAFACSWAVASLLLHL